MDLVSKVCIFYIAVICCLSILFINSQFRVINTCAHLASQNINEFRQFIQRIETESIASKLERIKKNKNWIEDRKKQFRKECLNIPNILHNVKHPDETRFLLSNSMKSCCAELNRDIHNYNRMIRSYQTIIMRSCGGSQYRGFENSLPKEIEREIGCKA